MGGADLCRPSGGPGYVEEKRLLLEKRLNELMEEADRYFGKKIEKCKS